MKTTNNRDGLTSEKSASPVIYASGKKQNKKKFETSLSRDRKRGQEGARDITINE